MNRFRFIVCVVIGLFSLIGFVGSSKAAIVYSGIYDLTIRHESYSLYGEYDRFELFTDDFDRSLSIGDFRGSINLFNSVVYESVLLDNDEISWSYYVGFSENTVISNTLPWIKQSILTMNTLLVYDNMFMPQDSRYGFGDYFDRSNVYFPWRVHVDEEIFYGWIRMSHSMENEQFIIHDWAWNDAPGESIRAGEVPEPGTVALWGGLGILAFVICVRRRRGWHKNGILTHV